MATPRSRLHSRDCAATFAGDHPAYPRRHLFGGPGMACYADHPQRVGSTWPSDAAASGPSERGDAAGRRSLIALGAAEPCAGSDRNYAALRSGSTAQALDG